MENAVLEAYERLVSGLFSGLATQTIIFGRQPDGRWLIAHQHLSPRPD